MNWDGFGIYFRVVIEVGAVLLTFANVYALYRFWSNTSLGQKFFGFGLLFSQLYILDITREALSDDFGWRWRLIFLLVAQICFLVYIMEPMKTRRENGQRLTDALNGKDEEKSS